MNKDTIDIETAKKIANSMREGFKRRIEYLEQKEKERKELRNLRIFAVGLLLLTAVCGVAMFKTTHKATTITDRYGIWRRN